MNNWRIFKEENSVKLCTQIKEDWQSGKNICLINPELLKLAHLNIIEFIKKAINEIQFSYDQSILLCTSGTTGNIKLALLEKKAIEFNIKTIHQHLKMDSNYQMLLSVPLFHAFGLNLVFFHSLFYDLDYQVFKRGDKKNLLRALVECNKERTKIFLPLVPQLIDKLPNDVTFSHIEGVSVTGGDIVSTEQINRLKTLLPNMKHTIGYGMTEAGPIISHTQLTDDIISIGQIGRTLPLIKTDIINGELAFRSPGQCSYLYENNQWKNTYDQWLMTGDLISEINGQLYFIGRLKNRIKINSEFIYPEKIIQEIKHYLNFNCSLSLKYTENRLILICHETLETNQYKQLQKVLTKLPSLYRPKTIEFVSIERINALGKIQALISA